MQRISGNSPIYFQFSCHFYLTNVLEMYIAKDSGQTYHCEARHRCVYETVSFLNSRVKKKHSCKMFNTRWKWVGTAFCLSPQVPSTSKRQVYIASSCLRKLKMLTVPSAIRGHTGRISLGPPQPKP